MGRWVLQAGSLRPAVPAARSRLVSAVLLEGPGTAAGWSPVAPPFPSPPALVLHGHARWQTGVKLVPAGSGAAGCCGAGHGRASLAVPEREPGRCAAPGTAVAV